MKIPDLSSDPKVLAALRTGESVRIQLASFQGSILEVLIEPGDEDDGYLAEATWLRPNGSRSFPWP